MTNTLSSLSTPVMPPALSLLIMLLGAYVALDLGQRVTGLAPWNARRGWWLRRWPGRPGCGPHPYWRWPTAGGP